LVRIDDRDRRAIGEVGGGAPGAGRTVRGLAGAGRRQGKRTAVAAQARRKPERTTKLPLHVEGRFI
jgi:hypothetical protein